MTSSVRGTLERAIPTVGSLSGGGSSSRSTPTSDRKSGHERIASHHSIFSLTSEGAPPLSGRVTLPSGQHPSIPSLELSKISARATASEPPLSEAVPKSSERFCQAREAFLRERIAPANAHFPLQSRERQFEGIGDCICHLWNAVWNGAIWFLQELRRVVEGFFHPRSDLSPHQPVPPSAVREMNGEEVSTSERTPCWPAESMPSTPLDEKPPNSLEIFERWVVQGGEGEFHLDEESLKQLKMGVKLLGLPYGELTPERITQMTKDKNRKDLLELIRFSNGCRALEVKSIFRFLENIYPLSQTRGNWTSAQYVQILRSVDSLDSQAKKELKEWKSYHDTKWPFNQRLSFRRPIDMLRVIRQGDSRKNFDQYTKSLYVGVSDKDREVRLQGLLKEYPFVCLNSQDFKSFYKRLINYFKFKTNKT